MCIIVYKKSNIEFPSWSTLKTCFENNPDGAGFMYADGNAVHISKGFMTWQDFKKAIKPFKSDEKMVKLPFVMHFRISTHGGVSKGLTHPFPLTDNANDLMKLQNEIPIGVAHNGIIPMCSHHNKLSDTADFISDYLTKLIYQNDLPFYEDDKLQDIIEELLSSRMVILDGNTRAVVLGSGWKEDDGILYSNTSYEKQKYSIKYSSKYSFLSDYGSCLKHTSSGTCDLCCKNVAYENLNAYGNLTLCDECYAHELDNPCMYDLTGDWSCCNICDKPYCIY